MYVYASTFLAIVMITYNVFIRILNITDILFWIPLPLSHSESYRPIKIT